MAQGQIYYTFPIMLLSGKANDIRTAMSDVMYYCGFVETKAVSGKVDKIMAHAGHKLGINWGDVNTSYNNGQKLFDSIPARSPMTSISKVTVFEYYQKHKTEFEIECFLAFAALRSIIQTKSFTKITNDYLIARMAGMNSAKDARLIETSSGLGKYLTRYHMDKLKIELQDHWGLKMYAQHTRGFYVSFKMNLGDLVFEAEKRRKTNIHKLREKEKEQAVNKALNKLFKTAQ